MTSKEKGDIGEIIIMAEFIKKGITVAKPFGDNARYDLIADFNGKLNKIQVKYCDQKIRNNSVICPCASSKNHTTNKKYTTYEHDIDYMAFYLKEWDICVIISIDEISSRKSICFRKDKPKTNQKNVHMVEDYTFNKLLP